MAQGLKVVVLGSLLLSLVACTGPTVTERKADSSGNPALGLINRDIMRLGINIEGIKKRMAEMQALPASSDPTQRELRALDLSTSQLHQQQWILQRDHLLFAKEQLKRASESQAAKQQLLEEWRQREQQYEKAIEELRQQRMALERKRVQVEGQLVERSLQ